MTANKPLVRRRQWKRFKIKGSAIVMLNKPSLISLGKPRLIELGPVIDISMGGLAVQYIESKKRLTKCDELSINVPGKGIQLESIPFTVISDVEIAVMPDSTKIKNRCVQFGELSSYQAFQLEAFINKYGADIARDRRSALDRRQFDDPKFEDEDYRILYDKRYMGERRKG